MAPWVGQQYVIVAFSELTHLRFAGVTLFVALLVLACTNLTMSLTFLSLLKFNYVLDLSVLIVF